MSGVCDCLPQWCGDSVSVARKIMVSALRGSSAAGARWSFLLKFSSFFYTILTSSKRGPSAVKTKTLRTTETGSNPYLTAISTTLTTSMDYLVLWSTGSRLRGFLKPWDNLGLWSSVVSALTASGDYLLGMVFFEEIADSFSLRS